MGFTPLQRTHSLPVLASILAALSISSLALAVGPSGNWTPFNPAVQPSPSPRMYLGAVYDPDGHRMVVFGGHPQYLNDVWQFDLAGGTQWTAIATQGTPPSPRWGHAAVYDPVRKRMIVMGGFDGVNNLADVYALTLTGAPTWSSITPAIPGPLGRRNHLLVYDSARDRILVFGGYTGGTSFTNDVWSLNLSGTPAWTDLSSAGTPPAGRSMVGGIYDPVADRLVVHGGWDGANYRGDLFQLSLSGTPTWSTLTASGTPPGIRRDNAAVFDPVGDRMVFFGGFDGNFIGDVWTLSLGATPTWTLLAPPGPAPTARSSHTAVLDPAGPRMVVFGGYDLNYRNDVTALDLSAGSEHWVQLSAPPQYVPGANCDYSVAYDEARNRAVYFGGKENGYWTKTWALTLGPQPSWSEIATPAGPSGRHSHSAVVDAPHDRLLMFGGYDGNYLNDLWSLHLTGPPQWTQLFPGGPTPANRMYHTAITDPVRQRMVIFGGHPAFFNDVWELPYTGPLAWNQLLPTGTPPSPRWGHCSIYDPLRDRMIVFGGFDATSTNLNDTWVLKFTPSLQWLPLGAIGPLPPGRRNATLVYDSTRDRLLLFGGFGPGFLNDVWELPLGGVPQWRLLTPTGGPPQPRDQITGIYEPGMDRLVIHAGWDNVFLADTWFLGFDQPTAARVSVVRAEATNDGIQLVWQIAQGGDSPVTVERSSDPGVWSRAAEVTPDGTGRATWTDRSAPAASRLGYRLTFDGPDGASSAGEVWVDLPARGSFAIRSIGPNPASDRVAVGFSLPVRHHVTLDVIDLSGRRVVSRDLGVLGPGEHRQELDEVGRLPLGLYMIRVTSGASMAVSRLLVVR